MKNRREAGSDKRVSRPPWKVLLVGCGHAGMLHERDPKRPKPASFLGGLRSLPDRFRLAGLCDIDPEVLLLAREQVGEDIPAFVSLREGLEAVGPDVVGLATWTRTHVPLMHLCLDQGIRGLVVEKPLCILPSQARAIDRRLRQHPLPVEINHLRRWDNRYQWARDVIRLKPWGPLRSIHAQVLTGRGGIGWERQMRDREGGGALFHDGTHMVDLLLFLLGRPLAIQGVHARWGRWVEHSLCAMLRFPGDVEVFLEVGGERDHFAFSLRLEFAGAVLTVGNGLYRLETVQESPRFSGFSELAPGEFPHHELRGYPHEGYAGPWVSLARSLAEGHDGGLSASWRDGVAGVYLMNRLLDRAGRKRIRPG